MTTTDLHTQAQDAPEDAAVAEHVEKVLNSLTKLIHGIKLYAENNPRLKQYSQEFHASLEAFFKHEQELIVAIDQRSMTWNEIEVYANDKREDSIAFLLHKDGVGELTIGAGAVGPEIDHFVEILAAEFHGSDGGDDVVTRFWNADFENISYRVLDDYLSPEGYDSRTEEVTQEPTDHAELRPSLEDKGRVIVTRSDPLESIDTYLKKMILRTCESSDEAERESYFQGMVGSFFTVGNDEMALYQEELRKEDEGNRTADFVDAVILFTLFPDPVAVRDVCGVLERIVLHAIENEDAELLTRLVSRLRVFRGEETLPEAIVEFCDTNLEKLCEPRLITLLSERITAGDGETTVVLRYLEEVGAPALDALIKALHRTDDVHAHKEVRDTLMRISGTELADVMERLDIDNPVVALDAVHMAIASGTKTLSPRMRELFFYPDRRVKLELIGLVGELDDEDIASAMIRVLDDPDKAVRMKAIAALSVHSRAATRARFEELAFQKELADRDNDEQEALFKALGKVGDAGTVAKIEKFVDKKGFVNFGKNRDNKFLAVRALEGIDLGASLKLLDRLCADGNELVASRARRAHKLLADRLEAEK